jgi:hypothetical protein
MFATRPSRVLMMLFGADGNVARTYIKNVSSSGVGIKRDETSSADSGRLYLQIFSRLSVLTIEF